MQCFREAAPLRAFIESARQAGRRVGFVPTMGNLHEGHYALIAVARRHADTIVASVFVNPTQFGANEDFARYPRTPEQDQRGLAEHGCDALFRPAVEEIYPSGIATSVRIHVPGISDVLEGAIRPGHFDGVATVVGKLFVRVQPHVAVFGRKDYQQLLVVRRLVEEMGFPIEIIGTATQRESNGLAMSSRNQYLQPAQRERAAAIHATLQWIRSTVPARGVKLADIERQAREHLLGSGLDVDYVAIRRATDLAEPKDDSRVGLMALIAARIGGIRLIDNLDLDQDLVPARPGSH
ncbi:MAG: pantoate--beta-alanine ligase [Rhodanobacteraceae bacterium]